MPSAVYPNVWAMTDDQAKRYWEHRRRGDEIHKAQLLYSRRIGSRVVFDISIYDMGLLYRSGLAMAGLDFSVLRKAS